MGKTIADGDLVAEILAGNTDRLRVLMTRYEKPLHTFICRIVLDRGVAEDVFIETFTRAYLSLRRFDGSMSSFKTWLYAIALNRARGHLRRRCPATGQSLDQLTASGPHPDQEASDWETGERIAHAVAALKPSQREVFVLYHYEGLDYARIANALRRFLGTVKSQMHRAIGSLRKRLRPLLDEQDPPSEEQPRARVLPRILAAILVAIPNTWPPAVGG